MSQHLELSSSMKFSKAQKKTPASPPPATSSDDNGTNDIHEVRFVYSVFSCTVLLILAVAGVLLAELSKDARGVYAYNTFTIPLVVEITKMSMSIFWLWAHPCLPEEGWRARDHALCLVPAFCYFVANNSMFFIVLYIGPTQFQILSTIKVVFNLVFMRIFLHRQFSRRQLGGVSLLIIGILVAVQERPSGASVQQRIPTGHMLALLSCLASSAGGVYSEKLLKHGNVHVRNIQLYSCGILFGILSVLHNVSLDDIRSTFRGYTTTVWIMVCVLSCSGITVSFVLRFSDNIMKSFVTSAAIVVTSCIQVVRGNERFSLRLIASVFIMYRALKLYNSDS